MYESRNLINRPCPYTNRMSLGSRLLPTGKTTNLTGVLRKCVFVCMYVCVCLWVSDLFGYWTLRLQVYRYIRRDHPRRMSRNRVHSPLAVGRDRRPATWLSDAVERDEVPPPWICCWCVSGATDEWTSRNRPTRSRPARHSLRQTLHRVWSVRLVVSLCHCDHDYRGWQSTPCWQVLSRGYERNECAGRGATTTDLYRYDYEYEYSSG